MLGLSLNHPTVRSTTKQTSPSKFQFNFSHHNFKGKKNSRVDYYALFQRWLAPSLPPHCLNPILLLHLTILRHPQSIYDFNFWLGLPLLTMDFLAHCLPVHFDFFIHGFSPPFERSSFTIKILLTQTPPELWTHYFNSFRRKPAISKFDWSFPPNHRSSEVFATTTGSFLKTAHG